MQLSLSPYRSGHSDAPLLFVTTSPIKPESSPDEVENRDLPSSERNTVNTVSNSRLVITGQVTH
jgi:hypothetical protein